MGKRKRRREMVLMDTNVFETSFKIGHYCFLSVIVR